MSSYRSPPTVQSSGRKVLVVFGASLLSLLAACATVGPALTNLVVAFAQDLLAAASVNYTPRYALQVEELLVALAAETSRLPLQPQLADSGYRPPPPDYLQQGQPRPGQGGYQDPYAQDGYEDPYGQGGYPDPYGQNPQGGYQDPSGQGGYQDPYGQGQQGGYEDPYGQGGDEDPYGQGGYEDPYGQGGYEDPYGQGQQGGYQDPSDPYSQGQQGQQGGYQDPHAQTGYEDPYAQDQQGGYPDPYAVGQQGAYDPGVQTPPIADRARQGVHARQSIRTRAGGAPISMNAVLVARKTGSDRLVVVEDGDALRDGRGDPARGDRLKIHFQTNCACHVYVLGIDATGYVASVFPDPDDPGLGNPVQPGVEYVLPRGDEWWGLDDYRGIEQVYFVASHAPREDIEQAMRNLGNVPRTISQESYRPVNEPAVVPTRGLVKVSAPRQVSVQTGGSARQVMATTFEAVEGNDLVITRWFRHE